METTKVGNREFRAGFGDMRVTFWATCRPAGAAGS